jgi:hypothetical protein
MKWRQGSKIPLNVYEDDRPVCQCHTADDARRLVDAMNSIPVLREALEQVERWLDNLGNVYDQALEDTRAALVHARGKT